ncbi:unnamed protein product [Coffea canephora]|uniref:Uncharacterized protein n=1 Tax=Coffea canephora TaxID=49390 RepID=A0A068V7S4_COFCA|nr:unnamed protein product [Coffea canephora]
MDNAVALKLAMIKAREQQWRRIPLLTKCIVHTQIQ